MFVDIQGRIERITYTNEENGFTIAKVKIGGMRELVTVVGNLMAPIAGEVLDMKGEWTNHHKYGQQFRVLEFKTKAPATLYGIRKYLGSGLIKGIGPVMAGKIVRKFDKDTLDIIENDIEKLTEINGIGKKRIKMIKAAWDEQKEIRDIMLFLQSHGVGSGYAVKIFKQYKERSIALVKENPYRLASEITGIGFVTADSIAGKLGFAKNSELRVQSGILYVLNQLSLEGHLYYPYQLLIKKCMEILDVDREVTVKAIGSIAIDRKIVIEDLNRGIENYFDNNKAVYLEKFYNCETGIVFHLKRLLTLPRSFDRVDSDKEIEWVHSRLSIKLAENQLKAVKCALESKVMIITGGPGTGKTTIINAVLKIFSKLWLKVKLSAPTGRAAKRMSETTGHEAKTIHRLLEFSFQKGGFQRNEKNPLNCDLLIIDEASMIDSILMYRLLSAVPFGAVLILAGDVNQLPSVGPGNVLNDIIASGIAPAVKLSEIFRQAKSSRIIVNAHRINDGILPFFKSSFPEDDFYFIQQEDPEKVLEIILKLVKERIPRRFGFDPVDDIQVLTPMHKGVVGAANLNMKLQNLLNPCKNEVMRGGRLYRKNDKVMQIRNNYDKDVFNGDIGRIVDINRVDQEVVICFDGRDITYDFTDLDEIVLAYAVSVHKSQGSEYPAVIIPVLTQHYMLLQRNLIYTAVTRGRKLVILIGTKKALAIAVKNNKVSYRYTRLMERLTAD